MFENQMSVYISSVTYGAVRTVEPATVAERNPGMPADHEENLH